MSTPLMATLAAVMNTIKQKQSVRKFPVVIDCVVFSFIDNQVRTLLIREKADEGWRVVTELVKQEALAETATRAVGKLTGVVASHLEQLKVYTDVDRFGEKMVVAITACAIVRLDNTQLRPQPDARWFAFHEIPPMDDRFWTMFTEAKKKLREKSSEFYTMAPLLPEKFTIVELQKIYESINEMRLDKGNFSKRFLSANVLRRLDEKNNDTSKKGSFYYEFDKDYVMMNTKRKHF